MIAAAAIVVEIYFQAVFAAQFLEPEAETDVVFQRRLLHALAELCSGPGLPDLDHAGDAVGGQVFRFGEIRREGVVLGLEAEGLDQLHAGHDAGADPVCTENLHRGDEAFFPFPITYPFRLSRTDDVEESFIEHLDVHGDAGDAGFVVKPPKLVMAERRAE